MIQLLYVLFGLGLGCAVGIAIGVRERRQWKQLAEHDPLTGALSRLGGANVVEKWTGLSRPFSAVLFDVANLHTANHVLGLNGGDAILRRISGVLRKRDGDHVVRLGGDEFLLLLPGEALEGAYAARDRLEWEVGAEALAPGVSAFLVGAPLAWKPLGPSLEELIGPASTALEERKQRVKREMGEAPTREEARRRAG